MQGLVDYQIVLGLTNLGEITMTITGPFFRGGIGVQIDRTVWYRQTRPYVAKLSLDRMKTHIDSVKGGSQFGTPGGWGQRLAYALLLNGDSLPVRERAYYVAYDRFAAKIKSGKTASLGVSLAEAGESFSMILNRSSSLLKSWKALRSGNLPLLYKSLFLHDKQTRGRAREITRRAQATRDFSSAYLELQFGWKPLLGDIHSACDVLQSTPKIGHVRSRSTGDYHYRDQVVDWQKTYSEAVDVLIKCQIAADVHVSNPNVALANQLGLVNPLQVAWDVVPFSFLVNWFVPVSQFLGSYSTFWGFRIDNPCITYLLQGNRVYDITWNFFPEYSGSIKEHGFSFYRIPYDALSVPSFSSRVQLPGGDLLGKATSSVALLLQSLSSRR